MFSTGRQIDLRTALAIVALAAWCLYEILGVWNHFPPDLSALYMAGYLISENRADLLYAAPQGFFGGTPDAWVEPMASIGLAGQDVLPYIYPPLWAHLLAGPTSVLTPTAFFNFAATVQIPLIAISVILAWRIAADVAIPLWVWILTSIALLATSVISNVAIVQIQPQITVIFLTLLAFDRYRAGQPVVAGATLALAAALKLVPAGFILIFILDRNWRALAAFAAFGSALAFVSLIVAGPALHWEFLHAIGQFSAVVFITSINYSVNVALESVASLLGLVPQIEFAQRNIRLDGGHLVLGLLGKAMMIAGLVWLIRGTHALDYSARLAARIAGISLLLNMFGPIGWVHYYLLPLLFLPLTVTLLSLKRGIALILAIAVLTSRPAFHDIRNAYAGDLPVALVGLVAMVLFFLALAAARPRQNTPLTTAHHA